MPLFPPIMTGLITARAASMGMAGSKFPAMASAISAAACQYILLSAVVNSTNMVLGPGSGVQTGRIMGLMPSFMSNMMLARAASQGIAGQDIKKLFDAVSFGVVNSLNAVIMQGTVIGGGPGTGIGKIIGLVPSALTAVILAQESFRLLAGSRMAAVASSISFGICTHIMSAGTVTITNVGVAAPPPVGPVPIPAAPGIGRLY